MTTEYYIIVAHGRYPYAEGKHKILFVSIDREITDKKLKQLDKHNDSDCWSLEIETWKEKMK